MDILPQHRQVERGQLNPAQQTAVFTEVSEFAVSGTEKPGQFRMHPGGRGQKAVVNCV